MAKIVLLRLSAGEWRQLCDLLRAARQKMPKEVLAPAADVLAKLERLEKQHRREEDSRGA